MHGAKSVESISFHDFSFTILWNIPLLWPVSAAAQHIRATDYKCPDKLAQTDSNGIRPVRAKA
jgi:hypothetical protein